MRFRLRGGNGNPLLRDGRGEMKRPPTLRCPVAPLVVLYCHQLLIQTAEIGSFEVSRSRLFVCRLFFIARFHCYVPPSRPCSKCRRVASLAQMVSIQSSTQRVGYCCYMKHSLLRPPSFYLELYVSVTDDRASLD